MCQNFSTLGLWDFNMTLISARFATLLKYSDEHEIISHNATVAILNGRKMLLNAAPFMHRRRRFDFLPYKKILFVMQNSRSTR